MTTARLKELQIVGKNGKVIDTIKIPIDMSREDGIKLYIQQQNEPNKTRQRVTNQDTSGITENTIVVEQERGGEERIIPFEEQTQTRGQKLRRFLDRIGLADRYDTEKLKDFGKGVAGVVQSPLDLVGFFADPVLNLVGTGINKLTGSDKPPVTFKTMADAIYTPQTEADQFANTVTRASLGVPSGVGLATKLAPRVLDKVTDLTGKTDLFKSAFKKSLTDDPVLNTAVATSIPLASEAFENMTNDETVGNVFGGLTGLLTAMAGRPIIKKTPLADLETTNIKSNAPLEISDRANLAKQNLDDAKRLTDDAYGQANFNDLYFDNNTGRKILNSIKKELEIPSVSAKEAGDSPYSTALNRINNKIKDLGNNEVLTMNQLARIERDLRKLYSTDRSENTVKLAMDKAYDELNNQSNIVFSRNVDGNILPDTVTRQKAEQARQLYRGQDFLKNTLEIVNAVKTKLDLTPDISPTALKRLVKEKIQQIYLGNSNRAKTNKRFLTGESKKILEDIMKSQTPYNDLLSFINKTTSDLKGFVGIALTSVPAALAMAGSNYGAKTVRENLDRKLVDDFLRKLTPSIDSPAINPNLQGGNVGNISGSNVLTGMRTLSEEDENNPMTIRVIGDRNN